MEEYRLDLEQEAKRLSEESAQKLEDARQANQNSDLGMNACMPIIANASPLHCAADIAIIGIFQITKLLQIHKPRIPR